MAAPLWVGRFLPLLDLPQHLAIATVLLHHDDPAWQLAAYFEPQPGELTPYWAHYLALEWLGRVMPVDVAARVFLSLYVVALPFAAMALARALGRPPAVALLVIPLALNANLYYGFIAYCWSVVLMLWALALLARQLDAPRAARGAGLALLAGALFFTHVQSFAFLLLAAARRLAVCIGRRRSPLAARSPRVARSSPATLALFLPWLYLSTTTRPGVGALLPAPRAIRGRSTRRRWSASPASRRRWPARTRTAPTTGCSRRGPAVAAAAVLARAARGPRRPAARHRARSPPPWPATSCCRSRSRASGTSRRGSPGPPRCSSPAWSARPPRWLAAAVLALSAATAANAAWHHAGSTARRGPFDRALAALPRGARVLGLDATTRAARCWSAGRTCTSSSTRSSAAEAWPPTRSPPTRRCPCACGPRPACRRPAVLVARRLPLRCARRLLRLLPRPRFHGPARHVVAVARRAGGGLPGRSVAGVS